MKNFISCITLSLAATLCAGATGRALADIQIDSTLTSNRIVFIDGKPATEQTQEYVDSIRRVISEFYYDQFRHFQDPGAPYFLFMSKDAASQWVSEAAYACAHTTTGAEPYPQAASLLI